MDTTRRELIDEISALAKRAGQTPAASVLFLNRIGTIKAEVAQAEQWQEVFEEQA